MPIALAAVVTTSDSPDGGVNDGVRFGVLGAAGIARKLIRAMHMVPGVIPYAIGSRSLEKSKALATEMGMSGSESVCYGSYQEVLDDAKVDVVYIPLPTGLHLEWVQKAALCGKHVLVEKPPASTVKELQQMQSACASAGVQFMDGTMWVHNPRAEKMKAVLKEEEFGKLRRIDLAFSFMGDDDFLRNDIRVKRGLDGLGAVGDVGWYCARWALWAKDYEMPTLVAAHPGTVFNDEGVIISCSATMLWPDGTRGSMDIGFDAAFRETVEFVGTKAVMRVKDHTIPSKEESCMFSVARNCGINSMGTGVTTTWDKIKLPLAMPQEASMLAEMARIVRAVREHGKEGLETRWAEESLKTMRVIEALELSAREGRQIDMTKEEL